MATQTVHRASTAVDPVSARAAEARPDGGGRQQRHAPLDLGARFRSRRRSRAAGRPQAWCSPRRAALDHVGLPHAQHAARPADLIDHLEVGAPVVAPRLVQHVAAAAVDEGALRVVVADVGVGGAHLLAVAARADGGGHEFGGEGAPLLAVLAQLERVVLVFVAGGHHHVGDLVRGDVVQQPLARGRVAAPAVHVPHLDRLAVVLTAVQGSHHHLVGDEVPPARPVGQALEQPALLLGAHDLRVGAQRLLAHRLDVVVARLVVAELARVEEVAVQAGLRMRRGGRSGSRDRVESSSAAAACSRSRLGRPPAAAG